MIYNTNNPIWQALTAWLWNPVPGLDRLLFLNSQPGTGKSAACRATGFRSIDFPALVSSWHDPVKRMDPPSLDSVTPVCYTLREDGRLVQGPRAIIIDDIGPQRGHFGTTAGEVLYTWLEAALKGKTARLIITGNIVTSAMAAEFGPPFGVKIADRLVCRATFPDLSRAPKISGTDADKGLFFKPVLPAIAAEIEKRRAAAGVLK